MRLLIILTLIISVQVKAQSDELKFDEIELAQNNTKEKFKKLRQKINVASKKIRERLSVEGGIGVTARHINASDHTEDTVVGPGFHTRFNYTYDHHWELGVTSWIYFAKSENLKFNIRNNSARSQGAFRSVAFAPTLKYTSDIQFSKDWHISFQAGPAWSIQTLKLKSFNDENGVLRQNHKITYEARGAVIGVGLEEILPYREMHASYVEFLYGYMKVYKTTLVDASDFTEVEAITKEERPIDIDGFIYMINFGILIF